MIDISDIMIDISDIMIDISDIMIDIMLVRCKMEDKFYGHETSSNVRLQNCMCRRTLSSITVRIALLSVVRILLSEAHATDTCTHLCYLAA